MLAVSRQRGKPTRHQPAKGMSFGRRRSSLDRGNRHRASQRTEAVVCRWARVAWLSRALPDSQDQRAAAKIEG